jgi:serine/threonine-protein kinase
VCEGLHYAHTLQNEHGEALHLVHRDIKPSNLMLNAQGVAKVLDFGISYAHGSGEVAGAVKGTWGYMAMEQAEGLPVGPAADVFGLGAVLYELATGEPLFPDKDNGEIRRKLRDDVAAQRAAALGGPWQDLGAVLVRALQRDPEARHRSAASFGRALSGLVADPVGVHEQLVRLHRELRAMDGSVAAGAQEKARSVSTMGSRVSGGRPPPLSAPGAVGLPIHTGDAHGVGRPRPEPRTSAGQAAKVGVGIGAVVLLGVAMLVMAFAAWTLWKGNPRRVEPVAANRATDVLGEIAAGEPVATVAPPAAAPPVAAVPAPAEPEAPAPQAPAPVEVAAPAASAPAPAKKASAATKGSAAAPARPVVEAVVVEVPPVEEPPVRIEPTRSADVTTSPKKADGLLTISSMPRAQVMIDGQYVRFTPLFQHELPSGSHAIVLVAEDGRRKSFKVDVPANGQVRRIWLFDEDRWSDD